MERQWYTETFSRVKSWPRASNMRRERTCPICKLRMGWDDKYREDTRTQAVWHVECESSPRYAKLLAWIEKQPTYVPTFLPGTTIPNPARITNS